MQLHQLRYVVSVADEGQFTRAAAQLPEPQAAAGEHGEPLATLSRARRLPDNDFGSALVAGSALQREISQEITVRRRGPGRASLLPQRLGSKPESGIEPHSPYVSRR